MKKNIFAAVMSLLLGVIPCLAQQNNPVAMLYRDGEVVATYEGHSAFAAACNAAKENDLVTLSGGSFDAGTIKAPGVTVRGSGCNARNEETGLTYTYIAEIKVVGENVTIEDVYAGKVNGGYASGYSTNRYSSGMKLVRSLVGTLDYGDYYTSSCSIENCVIQGLNNRYSSGLAIYNSVIFKPYIENYGNNSPGFWYNCLIVYSSTDFLTKTNGQYIFNNCIFNYTGTATHKALNSYYYSATNCLMVHDGTVADIFTGMPVSEANKTVSGENAMASVFKTFTGEYKFGQSYELTDEAAGTYLGSDDLQVGIYGGMKPFTTDVTVPYIVEKHVASRAVDGKLKVRLTVNAGN